MHCRDLWGWEYLPIPFFPLQNLVPELVGRQTGKDTCCSSSSVSPARASGRLLFLHSAMPNPHAPKFPESGQRPGTASLGRLLGCILSFQYSLFRDDTLQSKCQGSGDCKVPQTPSHLILLSRRPQLGGNTSLLLLHNFWVTVEAKRQRLCIGPDRQPLFASVQTRDIYRTKW